MLQSSLITVPILRLPDSNKPFALRSDASAIGLEAILVQEHDAKLSPVCYTSKNVNENEKKYFSFEQEVLVYQ